MTIARIRDGRALKPVVKASADPEQRPSKQKRNQEKEDLALRRRNHTFRLAEKQDAADRWRSNLATEVEDARRAIVTLEEGRQLAERGGHAESYVLVHLRDYQRLATVDGTVHEPPRGLEDTIRASSPKQCLGLVDTAENWCGVEVAHARSQLAIAVRLVEEEVELGEAITRAERYIGIDEDRS